MAYRGLLLSYLVTVTILPLFFFGACGTTQQLNSIGTQTKNWDFEIMSLTEINYDVVYLKHYLNDAFHSTGITPIYCDNYIKEDSNTLPTSYWRKMHDNYHASTLYNWTISDYQAVMESAMKRG